MRLLIATGVPFYAAAVVSFLVGSFVAARQSGVPAWRAVLLFSALIGGFFLGARLHFLLANRDLPSVYGLVGAHMPGGIALGALLGVVSGRILRLPVARLGDTLVPAFGISVLLIRLGCFVNGCCFGARADLPWSVRFAKGTGAFTVHMARGWLADDASWSLAVHPTQLYFASVGLVIVLIGLTWRHFQRRPGETWLLALATWGFANPLVESFRDPSYLTGTPHLGMSGLFIGAAAFTAFFIWRFGPLIQGQAHARGVHASTAGGSTLS